MPANLPPRAGWLPALRYYLAAVTLGSLAWEIAQMPLYTLWERGSAREILLSALHCAGGDVLIALASLTAALLLFGSDDWPERDFARVTVPTLVFGLGYALFSEWLNVSVRGAWAYRAAMPVLPGIGVGLAPLAQWFVVPGLALALAWAAGERPRPMRHALRRLHAPALAAALAATLPASAAAQGGLPLGELLRATHVHGLAFDPATPGAVLVATHHGLYRAALAEGRAEPLSSRRDDLMGFVPHPTEAAMMFASGHPAQGGNLGVIVSRDGGRSWAPISAGAGGPVDFHQMDVSKADPAVIYGVDRGLQVSRNGGWSWQAVGPAPAGLIALAASATEVARLYAGTRQGLLVSRDGGRSWQPAPLPRRPVSTVATAAGGTVYAFMLGQGLLRAEEGALDWRRVGPAPGDRYLLSLAVDPREPARLVATSQHGDLLASDDGGRSWRVAGSP